MTNLTVWIGVSVAFVLGVVLPFGVMAYVHYPHWVRRHRIQRRISDLELWRQKRDAWAVRDGDGITPIQRGR